MDPQRLVEYIARCHCRRLEAAEAARVVECVVVLVENREDGLVRAVLEATGKGDRGWGTRPVAVRRTAR